VIPQPTEVIEEIEHRLASRSREEKQRETERMTAMLTDATMTYQSLTSDLLPVKLDPE